MDDDYEMAIGSNMLSMKSSTVKLMNNNDATLLNHNVLPKCNKNTAILPTTSYSGNVNQTSSTEALQTRLTFAPPKLVNGRGAIANTIAIECFEPDSVDSSTVKEEPLSPDSSCPASPISSTTSILDGASHIIVPQPTHPNDATSQFGTINLNLANVATYANTDLVFEQNKVSQRRPKIRAP